MKILIYLGFVLVLIVQPNMSVAQYSLNQNNDYNLVRQVNLYLNEDDDLKEPNVTRNLIFLSSAATLFVSGAVIRIISFETTYKQYLELENDVINQSNFFHL